MIFLSCHSERSEESVSISGCVQILRIAQDDTNKCLNDIKGETEYGKV